MNVYIVRAGDAGPTDRHPGVTIIGDAQLALHNRYSAERNRLYLIRPDGYIAYRDQPADKERLQYYLASVFNSGSR